MKILYAASNRDSSFLQLKRFLYLKNRHEIKIAGFKNNLFGCYSDWNLESLQNFSDQNNNISFANDNYVYYVNEIKKFKPDLVISDLEIYTSNIAIELGIKLWQVSSLNLYYATKNKLGIYNKYGFLFDQNLKRKNYISFILQNSDRKFVSSHLCDIENKPELSDSFIYIRPNYYLSEQEASNGVIAASLSKNIDILKYLKNKKSILFSKNLQEKYNEIDIRDFDNNYDDIGNCKQFISNGDPILLADAFYNQKNSLIFTQYDDIGCVIASFFSSHYIKEPIISIDDNIKSLSYYIENFKTT